VAAVRLGIVGAGWVAGEHVRALATLSGVEVVAVCDVDPGRAASLAGGARPYGHFRSLLDQEDLDAVVVATPPLQHREPALEAIGRGIPTYLEKPIARTLDDAEAIVAGAEESGAVCAIGYQWHALSLVGRLRALVAGDEIGLLLGVSIGPTASRPWFLDRRQGGGNLLERGSHHLDLARLVGGPVRAVQATASSVPLARASLGEGDIDDALSMTLRFDSGALGVVVVAWTAPGQPGTYALDAVAARSSFRLDLDPSFRLHGVHPDGEVDEQEGATPLARSLGRFLDAVRRRDPAGVACTPADALATLRVALAAERSLEIGRPVEVGTQ